MSSAGMLLHHWMDQPPLQLQPVIAPLLELRDRVLAEKFRGNFFLRRFAGERFDAVLAKLEEVPIAVRARPGAALAIEAILLVNLDPIPHPARQACLANCEPQAFGQRPPPSGDPMRLAQLRPLGFFRWLRS
jgi:hypothetical protein